MQFIQLIWTLARKSEAIRQSAILVIGTSLTGVIMAVAMILASRSLGPENFGVFSVSIAVMSLVSKGVDMGLSQLMPRLLNKWKSHPDKSKEFLGQTVFWKLRLAVVTFVVSILIIPLLTQLLNYPYPNMLFWAIIGAIVISLYEYIYLLLAAEHKFVTASLMSVIQAVLKAFGFGIVLVFFTGAVYGITAVYYLAPLLSAGYVAWKSRDWMWVHPQPAGKQVRKEMFTFLWHSLIGVIAMTLIVNLDVLLVQRYLNSFETGLYAGATRIAAFIGFATSSVGGVLNNRVSRYHDQKTRKQYLWKSLGLALIAIIAFLLYLPFARFSLIWTIGPEYMNGLPALIILVLNAFLSFAIVPFISFFYSVDHPKYFSFGGILQVMIILLGNWLFLPTHGIQAAAWTKVAATAIFGIYTIFYVFYALHQEKKEYIN